MSMVMATHMGMGMDTVTIIISTIIPTAMQAMMVIITAATLSSVRSPLQCFMLFCLSEYQVKQYNNFIFCKQCSWPRALCYWYVRLMVVLSACKRTIYFKLPKTWLQCQDAKMKLCCVRICLSKSASTGAEPRQIFTALGAKHDTHQLIYDVSRESHISRVLLDEFCSFSAVRIV